MVGNHKLDCGSLKPTHHLALSARESQVTSLVQSLVTSLELAWMAALSVLESADLADSESESDVHAFVERLHHD